MKLPSLVTPGQPLSAKAFNELLAYVRSLDLRGGPGIRVQRSMVGTTVSAAEQAVQAVQASAKPYIPPFMCSLAGVKISVAPGYVNGQVPTVNGVALDAVVPPTLTCYSGSNVVYLKTAGIIDTETGAETVARAVVEVAQTAPEDSVTAYAWTAYQVITSFSYSEEAPPGELPQHIQVNLKAANFGILNAYFA